jgi:hypothetical protein
MMYCNQKTEVKLENATLAKFSDVDGHIGSFRRLGVNQYISENGQLKFVILLIYTLGLSC